MCACKDNTRGTDAGATCVFDLTGTRLFKKNSPDTRDTQLFGLCVAVTDDLLVVGAPENTVVGDGGANVYSLSGSLLKRLPAMDAALGDQFAWRCAAAGTTVVVGML